MSFVGDTSSIPVACDGGRLLHDGRPLAVAFDGSCNGRGRLYVRPKDSEIGAPDATGLDGTVVSVLRTATGRRAQVAVGAPTTGEPSTIVEAEVDLARPLAAGDRVGLRFLRARAFSE
jgi:hypothetical protein